MTISKNDYQEAALTWRRSTSAIASESDITADEAGEAMALFLTVSVNALKTKVKALEARLEALENK